MAIEFNYRRRIESINTSVAVGQINQDKDQGVKDGDPHVVWLLKIFLKCLEFQLV
jgi:hypothetical protein